MGIVLKQDTEKLGNYARIGLSALNHRGEDAHGISFLNPQNGRMETIKSMGLVRDSKIFDGHISGSFLIGHTRYRTSSTDSLENAQPIPFALSDGRNAAIAQNGNLTNDKELLKNELRSEKVGVSDTRILGMLLGRSLREGNAVNPVREVLSKVRGSYSITVLLEGKVPAIMAVRDPYGYMPLCVGSNEDGFFVASESVAFGRKYLDVKNFRDVAPGELLVMNQEKRVACQLFKSERKQYCMFQPVYMCRPDSAFEGDSVYVIRERLGAEIAKHYRPRVDFVTPVPESGVPVGYGYSQATGVPVRMGVVKDRYESGRSFMQDNQEKREKVVNKKLNIIPEVVEGKSVLLFEDSLVRGTTIKNMIAEIRFYGATEVHIAFSCPPIISECRYGIDFYNKNLIARPFRDRPHAEMNREIAKIILADSVYYQTADDMVKAIGVSRENLCLSCLTGVYVQPGSFSTEEERKK